MQAIIYNNESGGVAIVWPIQEALAKYGIEAIALKDVPFNKPFKIVNVEDLPLDGTLNEQGIPNIDKAFRDQWTVDEADLTDGVGLGHARWFIKELENELAIVNALAFNAPPKGENTNSEISDEEFEALYQEYLTESQNQFDTYKVSEILRIETQITALQNQIALES
jgi:hypothetical protein